MKLSGKLGDIHIAMEGLSSVRIQVPGQVQPMIVSLQAAEAGALAPLSGKDVTLEIAEKPPAA